MKTKGIRWLIVIFVLLPPLFVSLITAGPGGPRYRLKERIEVVEAYIRNPSASTKAALDEESAREDYHYAIVGLVLLLSLLLIDTVVIYFFWNYGARKTVGAH